MKPSIGRIVHWVDRQGECVAAIITSVIEDTSVYLTSFPAQDEVTIHIVAIQGESRYTWHWPERVD